MCQVFVGKRTLEKRVCYFFHQYFFQYVVFEKRGRPLIRPYFLGGGFGGVPLGSHETIHLFQSPSHFVGFQLHRNAAVNGWV